VAEKQEGNRIQKKMKLGLVVALPTWAGKIFGKTKLLLFIEQNLAFSFEKAIFATYEK
jgi:hypothetical protein